MRKPDDRGYFTLEATLLLPFVFGVVLLVIYLWFFIYDRALMELDTGAVALRTAVRGEMDAEERGQAAGESLQKLYEGKYAAWSWEERVARYNHGKVSISCRGSINFPFPGLQFWNGGSDWGAACSRECAVMRPCSMLRTYRKVRAATDLAAEAMGSD